MTVPEEIFIILPQFCLIIWGNTDFAQINCPVMFTSITRRHSSVEISKAGQAVKDENKAALFIKISMRPCRSIDFSMTSSMSS